MASFVSSVLFVQASHIATNTTSLHSDVWHSHAENTWQTWVTNFREENFFHCTLRSKINEENILHCNLSAVSGRDWLPTDQNIPTMSEISLHDIASVSAIRLVDKPLPCHLTSRFGKRTVNTFWGCMECTHGIAESQAITCCLAFKSRNLTPVPYIA